ncbi:MAG: phosphomannomutase/phosphoglucomutase [Gemmatimonadetes bacterium]|nr:phosphomannomutase/phosphoglucomutase [Gemmatimonadota bacterium]NIP77720.1 phosphomannomutase/phosphoglucomutase [Gemmatimonadota bacterium]NIR76939.1 phosphomannomutase/phosphoglucomutase [Gemmatimonadota bacterium]NIU29283.1 phosphomannomutase/phosphoglucomutase [Gemmatimonadota bacterium]NIU34360.1 phosphomannomutase [Gemmatimonadota bacterium]
MNPNPQIFREYDIRGIVGEDLDPAVAEAVGAAYGAELTARLGDDGHSAVMVGMDNRPSSPDLVDGLVRGLTGAGVDVTAVGTVPTPVAYWCEKVLGGDGALQVTGSHNPPEYNGIKMTMEGRPFYGRQIQDLLRRIREGDLGEPGGGGERSEARVLDRYVEDAASRVRLERPVSAVVDCGNGTTSVVAVRLLRAVGAEVTPLFCESDGTFPNHHPDPTVDENLEDLVNEVRASGAELGIAFDGDGDRLGAVDENGEVVRADLLLLLFGLDLLERRGPGQKLVFDVKCSQALPEVFEAAGGEPIMWKTGHSLMKEKMRETDAPLGGELSGHLFLAEGYYGFDDAAFAACRLLELLSRDDRTLSERIAPFPSYVSTPEIRIEVGEDVKFELVERAKDHFRALHDVIEVDGVRILFGDGWGLLRTSNTQPVVVARFEARTPERLEEIRDGVLGWLRDQGVEGVDI